MKAIEQLSDDQVQGLLKKLATNEEPQRVANDIMFFLSGYELEEADGLNLELSTTDESVIADIRFAAGIVRDVVPEYESVQIGGTEPHEDGQSTIRLTR